MVRRLPSGRVTWLVLACATAAAAKDTPRALKLATQALEAATAEAAQANEAQGEGARDAEGTMSESAALPLWCKLLVLLLSDQKGPQRQDALRELVSSAALTKGSTPLRSAVLLSQGEACLAAGQGAEAEKFLARCVKHTIGEARCDGLTAEALLAIPSALDILAKRRQSAAGSSSAEDTDAEDKRRRVEDALSSALIISSRMRDDSLKAAALKA
jgi:hypothetical protein